MNSLMLAIDEPGSSIVLAVDDGNELLPVARRQSPAAGAIVGGVES